MRFATVSKADCSEKSGWGARPQFTAIMSTTTTQERGSNITEKKRVYRSRNSKTSRRLTQMYKRYSGKLRLSGEEKSALAYFTFPLQREERK